MMEKNGPPRNSAVFGLHTSHLQTDGRQRREMNPTGCDAMMFSDQVFILPRADGTPTCDTSLYEFWILGGVLIGIKALGLLGRVRLFRIRVQKERVRNAHIAQHMLRRHLPVGALLDIFALIMYILTVVLCGLDIANAVNGASFALAGLCFIPFAIGKRAYIDAMLTHNTQVTRCTMCAWSLWGARSSLKHSTHRTTPT